MGSSYLVVIGDMVGSKSVEDRLSLQNRLSRAFETINRHSRSLTSPYTITLGDEFQAVFHSPAGLFESLLSILSATFPQEFRFAVSIGEIVTEINRKQSIGMDGPAFHRARQIMTLLKKKKAYFHMGTPDHRYDELFSATVEIMLRGIFRYRQTNRARLFLQALLGKTPLEISEEDQVTRWNVSKNMRNWQVPEKIVQIKEMERLLGGYL